MIKKFKDYLLLKLQPNYTFLLSVFLWICFDLYYAIFDISYCILTSFLLSVLIFLFILESKTPWLNLVQKTIFTLTAATLLYSNYIFQGEKFQYQYILIGYVTVSFILFWLILYYQKHKIPNKPPCLKKAKTWIIGLVALFIPLYWAFSAYIYPLILSQEVKTLYVSECIADLPQLTINKDKVYWSSTIKGDSNKYWTITDTHKITTTNSEFMPVKQLELHRDKDSNLIISFLNLYSTPSAANFGQPYLLISKNQSEILIKSSKQSAENCSRVVTIKINKARIDNVFTLSIGEGFSVINNGPHKILTLKNPPATTNHKKSLNLNKHM